jgi:hypothetical protein
MWIVPMAAHGSVIETLSGTVTRLAVSEYRVVVCYPVNTRGERSFWDEEVGLTINALALASASGAFSAAFEHAITDLQTLLDRNWEAPTRHQRHLLLKVDDVCDDARPCKQAIRDGRDHECGLHDSCTYSIGYRKRTKS